MNQKQRVFILAAVAMLVSGSLAVGQSFYGSVVGSITDPTGAAVPNASVSITNNGTGERRAGISGSEGEYRFVNLVPGLYKLQVESQGFKRTTQDNVRVEVESVLRVDMALQVGDMSQSVEVTADVPLIQTENATMSQVVTARTVQEMPLNGRNVLSLVSLVPGVVPQGGSNVNLSGQNIFSAGNFQIGGGTANQSATYLDGGPVNITYGNLTALVPTQDAVSEFRVQTNNNSAEYGRYTGGVVNLTSKGGTNGFHGSAYEFLRNRSLNAGTFFANATGAGKPAFTQNQFGANLGGPIQKDKTFFFASYEGFRLRQGLLFTNTVPTQEILKGDFSKYMTAQGALIPIYDPQTTCGVLGNPACAEGASILRSPFPGNVIPPTRFDKVAANLKDRLYGLPNTAGQALTNNFNFSKNASVGGDNDQLNLRGDRNVSESQHLFVRYSRWSLMNLAREPYENQYYFNGAPPESFTTHQAIIADTYTFTPTMFFDVRLSFLRFVYDRLPESLGFDMSSVGLPSYMNQVPLRTLPVITASGYNQGGQQRIASRNANYALVPTMTKIAGTHTIKFGGEIRRMDSNFFQVNSSGGNFTFDNLFTSRNPTNPGATGNGFASFLLGTATAGNLLIPNLTAASMRYQGYFINDTWQATKALTLSLGLRWEIPGVWTERYDRLATFNPVLASPIAQTAGLPNLRGQFVLVKSDTHPERSMKPEPLSQFAPRIGVAYRLNPKTVIRTGAGLFFIPADAVFMESPYQNPVNTYSNSMAATLDGSLTPVNLLSNPFPQGLLTAPGRNASYQNLLLGGDFLGSSGGGASAIIRNSKFGYTAQWNFAVQRDVWKGIAVDLGYAALRGVHLPNNGMMLNQLPDQYLSLGTQLNGQVANPFYGIIQAGPLAQRTIARGQLLRPFPQYQTIVDPGGYVGNSTYHSLQMKVEKRFAGGGSILGAYTFSKNIADAETGTAWLENGQAAERSFQNWNNLRLERSLSNFDSRQRVTISYVYDLPFGKGKAFASGASGMTNKLISGWGLNGVTTFQAGFPLRMTATPNTTGSYGGGFRPNAIAGCDKTVDGTAQERLNRWFNTSCFPVPGSFQFGNESRTDPNLRTHGIANYDFALFKRTSLTERVGLEFRGELFNLFNRVQFGAPNTVATTAANGTFGVVSSQANTPRLVQFALRLLY